MRLLLIMAISLLTQASAQQMQLVLPDTTLTAKNTGAIKPLLDLDLAGRAAGGNLGLVYVLKDVSPPGPGGGELIFRFGTAQQPVPPPDTLVAVDPKVREIRVLNRILAAINPVSGDNLTSNGRAGYLVQRKQYFIAPKGGAPGYGVLYRLKDISVPRIQVLGAYEKTGSKRGQLVGELALELPNLLGTLRYLQIDFRRLSTATQQLGIVYAEPHLGLLPLGGRVSFFQDTRDSMYVQRDIKVQLTSLPGQPWSTAIGVGRRVLQVTGSDQSAGISYRLSSINLDLFRNALDRTNNPRRGYQVRLRWEAGTLANSELDRKAALSSTDVRATLVGSPAVWGLVNLTWAQEVQATGVAGYRYTPRIADYARFGGSATLRGYREDQFAAAWGIVSRTELRYPINSSSRLYLFVDAGRLDNLDPLTAAGAGIVATAGKNLIQLDFAWTPSDSFGEGKVHLRLTNFLGGNTAGK